MPNIEDGATSCEMPVIVPVAKSTGQKRNAKCSSITTEAPRKKLQREQVMFETNEVDEHDIPAQILDDFFFEEHWTEEDWNALSKF